MQYKEIFEKFKTEIELLLSLESENDYLTVFGDSLERCFGKYIYRMYRYIFCVKNIKFNKILSDIFPFNIPNTNYVVDYMRWGKDESVFQITLLTTINVSEYNSYFI